MKRFSFLRLAACIAIVMTFAVLSDAAKAPDIPDSVKLKPDIVISDLKINRISVVPAGHNVQINVTAANRIMDTATGAFKVKVEWTENPTVGFNLLGTGGVTNLAYSSTSAVIRNSKTLSFNHQVPTGKSYKYRVTADYMNQVDEANEANNVASAGYTTS
ncbi:MAG: hypothetical protein JW999_00520 [Methanotrichaceae archaeon]|nr:hypothetical protein [Methanotrichaceae archaeon]